MTALALVIDDKNLPAQLTSDRFTPGGLEPIIEAIRQDALSVVGDISSQKGRAEIKSRAFRVAKARNAIDKVGKELVAGAKAQIKIVDAERSRAWDLIAAIENEARAPLTEWEEKDAKRIVQREAALAEMGNLTALYDGPHNSSVEDLEKKMARLHEIGKSLDWEEFAARAQELHKTVYDTLLVRLEARKKHVAEQDELLRLRKEAEERTRKDHEAKIAAEAAAKAQAEAEAKAKKEAEKAEQERLQIEREKEAAEARAKKAEADGKEAARKAEEARIAAEAKAKRDAEIAVENERKRAEEAKRQEEEATAKREADKKHRAKINGEALAAIKSVIASHDDPDAEDVSKAIVEAIAKGQIPHIKISY